MPLTPGDRFETMTVTREAPKAGPAESYVVIDDAGSEYLLELLEESAFKSGIADAFLVEARRLAQVEHPALEPPRRSGRSRPYVWMSRRHRPGTPLSLLIRRDAVEKASALQVLETIAGALGVLHAQGTVHSRLEPFTVTVDGIGAFLELGASWILERLRYEPRGPVFSNPRYYCRERMTGEPLGPACDVYALGLIAWELLSGEYPFRADTPAAEAYRKVMGDLRTVALPDPAAAVLRSCLAANPSDRPSSPEAFVAALTEALGPLQPADLS